VVQVDRGLSVMDDMSRDGLLLASSAVGAHREPSAVVFAALTATVGAAILNQATLAQLGSATAILAHVFTAACNVDALYRPYSSGGGAATRARRRSRRSNRNRKLNYYESRAPTAGVGAAPVNSVRSGSGATDLRESSTLTTTADVHVTGSDFATPEVTSLSSRPDVVDVAEPAQLRGGRSTYCRLDDDILADDDELEASGGRGGRAGSGNDRPTGSSSSSSSDEDIDDLVDEFEQRRLAAVARARADDQLIDIRCATDVTHRRALRALVAFSTSGLALFVVAAHAPRASHPVAVLACLLAALTSAASLVYLAWLPRSDVTAAAMTSSSRSRGACGWPMVRWVALVSLAVHCCLLAAVSGTCWFFLVVWTAAGASFPFHFQNFVVIFKYKKYINYADT